MGRFGFIPYVNDRLAGIEARPNPGDEGTWARSREHLAFPEYYAWAAQMPGAAGGAQRTRWMCTGPIAYKGHEALARDIDNLKAALAGLACEEAFMPAVWIGETSRFAIAGACCVGSESLRRCLHAVALGACSA
jgi:hypothetical protein